MARRKRRAGYLTREYRAAKRAMRPNRITARTISGGKHQTFTAILTSPLKTHTVTSGANRRKQHNARVKKERAAANKQARRERAAKARKRRDDAAYAKSVQAAKRKSTPRKPRQKPVPIAVDPRTGKAVTLAQAMKAYREANARADQLAAGQPGDAPARAPRAPKAPAAKSKPGKPRPRRKPVSKNAPPPPPPAPGKSLRGIYLAVSCACHGTGRIYVYEKGHVSGSVSCPEHGRTARGGRRIFSRRAMTDSGLPGVAGWLAAKYRHSHGNLDHKQERAVRQAGRERYAGPTVECDACDEGTVNRALTEQLREQYISDLIAQLEAQEKRVPSSRSLNAKASRVYPYDRCRACGGVNRVPDPHVGPWLDATKLRRQHTPTAREAATGRTVPGRRT
jgi:hypothetical protein